MSSSDLDSSSAQDSIAALEQALAAAKRKSERERKAREEAERLLEFYTRETYKANQALKRSLTKSQKRQAELVYLSQESAEVASSNDIDALLSTTVTLTGHFFQADIGTVLYSHDGNITSKQQQVWQQESGWYQDAEALSFLKQLLPLDTKEEMNHWVISALDEPCEAFSQSKWLVFLRLQLLANKQAWLVFLSSAELLDEETLFVLDTACGHLLSGIRRRINDIHLEKRNQELQDTVDSLEMARNQLIQSEKMASLGQMAAGVAHEINNPIGFIRANTEVLQGYLSDLLKSHQEIAETLAQKGSLQQSDYEALLKTSDLDFIREDADDLIQANLEGTDRVKEIVDSLKTFSHGADQSFAEISLLECIENALRVAWNTLKYDYQVNNQIPQTLPTIEGNIGQLQQVFVNLFVNAAQAMQKGGTLSLRARVEDNHIIVEVEDTGQGMDETTQKQLFTPFFTTKPVGQGTGLGLSISYAILESHGANIDVRSQPGQGTCFSMTFPIKVS